MDANLKFGFIDVNYNVLKPKTHVLRDFTQNKQVNIILRADFYNLYNLSLVKKTIIVC